MRASLLEIKGTDKPRGYSIVKNTGAWLDSLGSGILFEKCILGFLKGLIWTIVKVDKNDSYG